MVKLGDVYVDLNAVDAVAPMRGVMSGYSVYLSSGRFFDVPGLTEDEVEAALVTGGLLEQPEEDDPRPLRSLFTSEELAELITAVRDGFYWAAKDSAGPVYAYSEEPTKGKAAWINNDDVSRTLRLRAGDYDCLSFDDMVPIYIPTIFEGDAE